MTVKKAILIAATAAIISGSAQARELSFAIGHAPSSGLVKSAEEASRQFGESTGGDVTIKVYPLSLLSMAETSGGLREGLADIGTMMYPYFPDEFPHTNLVVESTMLLNSIVGDEPDLQGMVFSGAVTEFILKKCPECVEEFAAQNQVFISGAATSPYLLSCTKPVVTKDDLQGARLRAGGANWARWSQAIGASPITMSGNEMLEALNQGVIDCIILSTPDIRNFGMSDSVTHVTKGAPGGVYFPGTNINKNTWTQLTPEQRSLFLRAMSNVAVLGSASYRDIAIDVAETAEQDGVEIHDAAPDVVSATLEFLEDDSAYVIDYFSSQYGVTRGEEMLADLTDLLMKWADLIRSAESDEEYQEIFWDEIYADIDVAQYGID